MATFLSSEYVNLNIYEKFKNEAIKKVERFLP